MQSDKRIDWIQNTENTDVWDAFNDKNELLGNLKYERVGAHMHWCWYQEQLIRMSPGCLQEVRDKQKELLKKKRDS